MESKDKPLLTFIGDKIVTFDWRSFNLRKRIQLSIALIFSGYFSIYSKEVNVINDLSQLSSKTQGAKK